MSEMLMGAPKRPSAPSRKSDVEMPIYQAGRVVGCLEPMSCADIARGQVPGQTESLLFWVKSKDGTRVGRLGLSKVWAQERRVELADTVRTVLAVQPGVMYAGVHALLGWVFHCLKAQTVVARVPGDNYKALRLYCRCGFQPIAPEGQPEAKTRLEVAGLNETQPLAGVIQLQLTRGQWMTSHRWADQAAA